MRFSVNGKTVFASTGSVAWDASDEAVVFVHGAGMDHTVWVLCACHFARLGRPVLALDLPGHGRSDGPALQRIEALADWLDGVLSAAGCERANIVGHSMGALVAHAFARRHAARCERLICLGPSLPMPVAAALLDAAADDDHAAIDMANTWSHSGADRLGGNQNPGLWMMGVGRRLIERCAPGVFHADLRACNDYAPADRDAPTCPVTVVIATEDQMTPAKAGVVFAEASGTRRVVRISGSGHSMLTERPNEVLDAIRGALAQIIDA